MRRELRLAVMVLLSCGPVGTTADERLIGWLGETHTVNGTCPSVTLTRTHMDVRDQRHPDPGRTQRGWSKGDGSREWGHLPPTLHVCLTARVGPAFVAGQTTADRRTCQDDEESCADWAAGGECHSNPQFMMESCRLSCKVRRTAWRVRFIRPPRATRTPRTFGTCPSFRDHSLSPRAKP
jgi:hypothetical protein